MYEYRCIHADVYVEIAVSQAWRLKNQVIHQDFGIT